MKRILFLTAFTVLTCIAFAYSNDEGKSIFTTRCTACHAIDKRVVGPALMNVDQRHDEKWIISFVHSSQTVIKSGDTAAVALFKNFNSTIMPDHPDLSEENIKSILEYIKSEAKTETGNESPFAKPVHLSPEYEPLSVKKDIAFFGVYLVAVMALILVLLFCVRLNDLTKQH